MARARLCICFEYPCRYHLYVKTSLGYYLHMWQLRKQEGTAHSHTQPTVLNNVTILPIAILKDNYAYLVIDSYSRTAAVIDPSDPQAVMVGLEVPGVQA